MRAILEQFRCDLAPSMNLGVVTTIIDVPSTTQTAVHARARQTIRDLTVQVVRVVG